MPMPDFLNYAGKRVVVSGCSSGIGAATARLLGEFGAEVHGLDWKDPDQRLASFSHLDLRDPASIDAAVAGLGGTIDALFNCAGLAPSLPPLDVLKVNFIGTRHLTRRFLPRMGEGGAIANVASIGGLGWPQRLATTLQLVRTEDFAAGVRWIQAHEELFGDSYAFSKEALIVWTMVEAAVLAAAGVRINCTLPGTTQTPMMQIVDAALPAKTVALSLQPSNRRSTPEEQARVLLFLNSEAASYVNGAALPVDGGFMAGLATGGLSSGATDDERADRP